MDKKKLNIAQTVCLALFMVGIILLFSATKIGVSAAENAIQANGGSMDTEMFYLIMKSTTLSYQIGGAVCSLIGGIGMVLFTYKSKS